jgi:XTP/dITP diphosphohydrolase
VTKPKLLVATRNSGKMREYGELLHGISFELVSLDDLRINDEVEETGSTFHENAELKARTYGALGGLLTVADDSGLEVDALGGAPGIFSSRYGEKDPTGAHPERSRRAGSGPMSDADRVALLLHNLEQTPWERRTARFRCVIAVWTPRVWSKAGHPEPRGEEATGSITYMVGSVAGMIQYRPEGDEGFGYDPVFYLPSYGRTMAQLTLAEKNAVSHRSDAARKAVAWLERHTGS